MVVCISRVLLCLQQHLSTSPWLTTGALPLEVAAHECISEEALIHLRTYKYSSVDESYISHYILRHYVCSLQRDIEDED
jgi:hypothetical protein